MRAVPQQLVSISHGLGPLYLQIYHKIRALILSGAWPAGTRLPSSRALARDLGISRNTAILATEKLFADGWIMSRAGSGIYVSSDAPSARPPSPVGTAAAESPHRPNPPMPFEISHAAIDAFPVAVWSKIQSKVWGCAAGDALLEGARAGWRPLRNAVAGYLHAVRGIPCLLEQVLIVSSTRAAIDLSVRVLGRAGDQVWMEDPGYPWAREAFHGHGLSTVALPVSSEGIDVAAGIELAGEARLAYLTPACQFPTCSALTPARRAAILAWAASHDSYILEDDWDFNAVFDGRQPLDALAATQSDRVIFIHSFNRLLFPGLRIAAIVVPPHLVTDFLEARRTIDSFPNVANEMALTEFIEQGLLSAHLRKCRALFAERRATLHSCIERYLGRWLRVDKGRPGLHCLAWTRGRASRLASMARTGGVACTATSDFTIETDQFPDALLLGFATFPCEVIEDASRRLAEVFDDTLDAGDIWRGAGVS